MILILFIELKSNSKNAYLLNRNGLLKLRTENSNHLLLNDTGGGKVGIGTDNPTKTLEVAGDNSTKCCLQLPVFLSLVAGVEVLNGLL